MPIALLKVYQMIISKLFAKVVLYYVEEVVFISNYVLFGVTVLISTAISVDRLLVLLLRLRYRQVVTLKRTQAVILL